MEKSYEDRFGPLPKIEIPRILPGQRALVTGGSSGIGYGVAVGLAQAGADVVAVYHSDKEGAERAVAEIQKAGGRGFAMQADVGEEADVEALFSGAVEKLGGIDIVVSNAGIQKDAPIGEMTLDDWNAVLNTNLTGQFLCARAAIRQFRKQGMDPSRSSARGKLLMMSSVHDIIPWKGRANYTAAKGGLKMLMETLAQEVAPERIRINAISPGAIRTPINEDTWKDEAQLADLLTKIPYGRAGEPEDIARVAVFLASDLADYITGTTIYADGGMTLYPSFQEGG